ncbi:hypothetical protein KFE98_09770 [bacterium SCSIO 12741]|nr:hypothetical protein KFE98_09770 [bacterium SCSIO 12741]
MEVGFLHLHRTVAYLVLILVFVALLKSLFGFLNNKEYTSGDRKLALFSMIAVHIQLLLGIVLYAVLGHFSRIGASMGEGMAALRFVTVEHPVMMILAAVVITMGYSKAKRAETSKNKFKMMSLFYLIGFALILSRVPWDKLMP